MIFFTLYALLCREIKKSFKKLLYILPYFISVFILQAIAYRGEAYKLWFVNIDKKGVQITIHYFIRFSALIFFLAIVMLLSKKIKIPNNSLGREILRVIIFFKMIKKYFFKEFNKARKSKASFSEKIKMTLCMIQDIYKDVFKKYPFEEYVLRFIK